MKEKKYKYVSIFKKQVEILRYCEIYKEVMTKKERKYYIESDNTILLDKRIYGDYNEIIYSDLKTLIIDEEILKDNVVKINRCTANDIYINNHNNLGGITIPYDFFINNKSTIKFVWNKNERTQIEKINITMNDNVIPIETKLIEEITISTEKDKLLIKVENYNSIIMYKVDTYGDLEKVYMAREIKENDITNNILDLREFNKFEKIVFEKLKLDKLILNKEIIKNIFKYNFIFYNLEFDKLELIDDNEMKLLPTSILININEKDELIKCNNNIYIKNKENPRIIYIDKLDNIKVLDKTNIMKDDNIEDAKISIDYKSYCQTTNFLVLIKLKNGKYKVIINEKEYKLTDAFKNFLLLNKEIYLPDAVLEDLENNNWFNIIGKYTFNCSGFLDKYNAYLNYKERLNKLKKLGFSYNALMYLHDRKINSIINTETEEGLIDLNDLKDYEINSYNVMGEEYIKTKRLKKRN